MTHRLLRPDPVQRLSAQAIDGSVPPLEAAKYLRDGERLLIADHFGSGVEIISRLQTLLPPIDKGAYEVRQARRRAFREASLRLLAPIEGHRLALGGAESIGFLELLYPELPDFILPFVQAQELHGAWSQFVEGVHLPVLGFRLHPFYGTYIPTRSSHLELFGTWLSQYQGSRSRAIDVGTGCGVLAMMLCRAGFEQVLATDSNPNAVESVARELKRHPSMPIEPIHGDLLGEDPTPVDLVVFNPPWIPGEVESLLDRALHFEEGLFERFFERFFEQASRRLRPGGRVVLLFSNVLQLLRPDLPHPILAELERGRLRLVQKTQRKVKPTQGRRTRERVEVWELEKQEKGAHS